MMELLRDEFDGRVERDEIRLNQPEALFALPYLVRARHAKSGAPRQ